MNKSVTQLLKPLTLILALLAPSAFAATSAGEVLLLTGMGTATSPTTGTIRALVKGDSVFSGEIVSSGANSYLNLKFTDGSFILLRPNTRFVIETYAHGDATPPTPVAATPAPVPARTPAPAVATAPTPAPAAVTAANDNAAAQPSRAFFRLLRGGFRAVSGVIGKADPNEYRISTPVATIGIRGTDYIVAICDAACARDPVLRAELPEGAGLEGGVIANVIDGRINVNSGDATQASAPRVGSPFGWLGLSLLGAAAAPDSTPSQTDVDAGQTAAITSNGQIFVIDKQPQFLIKQPVPDPTTLCQ